MKQLQPNQLIFTLLWRGSVSLQPRCIITWDGEIWAVCLDSQMTAFRQIELSMLGLPL